MSSEPALIALESRVESLQLRLADVEQLFRVAMDSFQMFSDEQTKCNIYTRELLTAWDGFAKEQQKFNEDVKQFYNDQKEFNARVEKHFLI